MKPDLLLFSLSLVLLSLAGSGCATPAQPKAMIPPAFELQHRHARSVSVSAEGGQKSDPLGTSEISTEAFVEAVAQAIQASGVFSSVVQSSDAEYRLQVLIVGVDQPLFGFDMTVSMSTHWKLTNGKGESIFQGFVRSSYTAKTGDAFAGIKRLRLATEGASRENIKQGSEAVGAAAMSDGVVAD